METKRQQAEQRVAEAKLDLKDWEERANATLKEMEDRRLAPMNPQTFKDLGMDI